HLGSQQDGGYATFVVAPSIHHFRVIPMLRAGVDPRPEARPQRVAVTLKMSLLPKRDPLGQSRGGSGRGADATFASAEAALSSPQATPLVMLVGKPRIAARNFCTASQTSPARVSFQVA